MLENYCNRLGVAYRANRHKQPARSCLRFLSQVTLVQNNTRRRTRKSIRTPFLPSAGRHNDKHGANISCIYLQGDFCPPCLLVQRISVSFEEGHNLAFLLCRMSIVLYMSRPIVSTESRQHLERSSESNIDYAVLRIVVHVFVCVCFPKESRPLKTNKKTG